MRTARSLPYGRGVSIQGVSVWRGCGHCPGGSLSGGVSVQGSQSEGLCSGVSALGVTVQGGLCPGGLSLLTETSRTKNSPRGVLVFLKF